MPPAYLEVESPVLCDSACESAEAFAAGPPPTLSHYEKLEPWPLTLEEAVRMTLSNAKVLQRLGGRVVTSPQAAMTIYDPALQATNPLTSAEAALAAFDAQYAATLDHSHDELFVNNPFFGAGIVYGGNFNSSLSKQTASGASYTMRSLTNYNRNPTPFFTLDSIWTIDVVAEVRQPLLRHRGPTVNRIAGPQAFPGQYNGVLIGRIREDVSVADFEASIRDLVRDVIVNYWELYFAYQDLDTKLASREAARETWENRKIRADVGEGTKYDEPIARQQYFSFESQVQSALAGGVLGQPGVYGAERELRRLMGLPTADGRLIRPVTEPAMVEVKFDWDAAQQAAMKRRVELRRQKWIVKQRELELCAAKNLAQWRVDFFANYGSRGVGDNLFGDSSVPADGAVQELFGGELDNWQFGLDIQGPVGNRQGHLAVRNAQLSLCREKALLREQQRQILHDLGAAYTQVDRAFNAIKTEYNSRAAIQDEIKPKQAAVDLGKEDVFFLLEALQRSTRIESSLHRAVVDYNLALLDFSYQRGDLLTQFNVNLAEEAWWDPALAAASRQNRKIQVRDGAPAQQFVGPLATDASQDMLMVPAPNAGDGLEPIPVEAPNAPPTLAPAAPPKL